MKLLTRKWALAHYGFEEVTARSAWGARRMDGVIYFFVWEVDLSPVGHAGEMLCNLINTRYRVESSWGCRKRLEQITDFRNGENAYAPVMKQKDRAQSYNRKPLGFFPNRRYKVMGLNIEGESIDARLMPVARDHDDTARGG